MPFLNFYFLSYFQFSRKTEKQVVEASKSVAREGQRIRR